MQIISEIVKIEKPENISTEIIEKALLERKIQPLRWAIVDIKEKEILINVSYYNYV